MEKIGLVIDVNVFLAAFFFRSKIGDKILNSVRNEMFTLLSCDAFKSELLSKIYHFKNKVSEAEFLEIQAWFDFFIEISRNIEIFNNLKICRDPNDDYLINLAIDGKAKYLITRDKDLLEVKVDYIKKIMITPENFIDILRKTEI
jgi:putative PIN family toxin of toxin-antitoxin system